MVLKPQDVYVALKIVASQADRAPYSQLAAELVMSPSEVHASVRRAEGSHLLHGPRRKNRPNFSALEEFLLHGLKYVFPPERGEPTRGVPTSYAAEPLRSIITQGNEPSPVWPYEEGKQRGIAFEPLYKTAPIAALPSGCESSSLPHSTHFWRHRRFAARRGAVTSVLRGEEASDLKFGRFFR